MQHCLLDFTYKNQVFQKAEPYKLVNHKGIWYLAAKYEGTLKAFCFTQINKIETIKETFVPDAKANKMIEEEDSIWFSENKREVVLKVDSSVAHYFQRRDLLPNQKIDKTLEDGSLIVSSRIAHDHQILPLIRYWLPNIHVISPDDLRQNLFQVLRDYVENDTNKK